MRTHTKIFTTIILVCIAYGAAARRADEEALASSPSPCNSSVADCTAVEAEEVMMMELWDSQRFMEEKKRLSYGALKADQQVCGSVRRGQSYSRSCLPPSSNSYSKGCSTIYRCKRDT